MAYSHKVVAESSVDINLAKQLNVLLTQLGVKPENIVMQIGCSAVGYGYEYVASTMDRIRLAAFGQNDKTLQMPIVTPVSFETWHVKESIASIEDEPQWGPARTKRYKYGSVYCNKCFSWWSKCSYTSSSKISRNYKRIS